MPKCPFWKKQPDTGDVVLIKKKLHVVVLAEMSGGGTGHGPGDVYPDVWNIYVRKLDGMKYDPKAKLKSYITDAYNEDFPKLKVVGKMRMLFVWEED